MDKNVKMTYTHLVTICVNMIVKNEAKTIINCLASLKDIADDFVIVDTGSEDNTVQLIEQYFQHHQIKGSVHHSTWVDFATNRNEALLLARGRADYILFMDADWILNVDTDVDLTHLKEDWYMFRVTDGVSTWYTERLVKDQGELMWKYPVREILMAPSHQKPAQKIEQMCMKMQRAGGIETNRYERDIELLQKGLDAGEDPFHFLFYLANSYMLIKEHEKAKAALEQLSNLEPENELDRQKVYYALWMRGRLEENFDKKIQLFEKAQAYRPQRLEAAYEMVQDLRKNGQLEKALAICETYKATPVSDDEVYVVQGIYQWGMLREYAILCTQTNKLDEAQKAFSHLVTNKYIPAKNRSAALQNLRAIQQYAARQSS